MRVSLNEVEVMVRKAARGLGVPVGLAEDCGRQAAWLAGAGLDPLPSVSHAFEGLASGRAAPSPALGAPVLSAVLVGPSAVDRVVAGPAGAPPLRLGVVDAPLLVVASAACAAADLGLALEVGAGGPEPVAWARIDGGNVVVRAAPGTDAATCRDFPVRVGRPRGGAPVLPVVLDGPALDRARAAVFAEGVSVAPDDWTALGRLATRCLVPADARLRMSGAGAGLVDRD